MRLMKIDVQKAFRRKRLAELLDELGQAAMVRKTGLAGPYLWQMAHGEGKAKRNVPDSVVEKIERSYGVKYFDANATETGADFVKESMPKYGKDTPGWTHDLSAKQLLASAVIMDHLHELTDKQVDAIIALIESYVVTTPTKRPKKRKMK